MADLAHRWYLWPLLFLGGLLLLACTGLLCLSFWFEYGAEDRPIVAFVGILGSATLVYFAALALVLQRKPAGHERRCLAVILGVAVASRLILLTSQPILEVDFYRYLWDGRVLANGFNPYRYSPAQIKYEEGPAELVALQEVSQQSPAVRTILERVHYESVPTVYPPAAQAVFAMAAIVTPPSASLSVHVLVLKAVLLVFDLGTVAVVIAMLQYLQLPTTWCLAYAWCPLVLKEFANSGHLDAIAVFFTTLALYLLARGSTVAGMTGLGLGVLAKTYPLVLLPVVGAYLLVRRKVWAVAAFVVVVCAGYLPFAGGRAEGPVDPLHPRPHHAGSGLTTFLTQWQTNDFLFMLVYDNVRAPGAEPAAGWVIVPDGWRDRLDTEVLGPIGQETGLLKPAFVLTQALMGTILAGLCLRWAWRVYRVPTPEELLRGTFLTLAWGWLLSSAQNPWYLLWSLPFMVFAGRRSWFLLPGLVLVYYVRFWLDGRSWQERPLSEAELMWVEYPPFFLALALESWRARASRSLQSA